MSQTPSAEFRARSDAKAKNLDYAFVIAGWPTIYTVVKETPAYTLAGDLSTFTEAKAWSSIPACIGQMAKGRPEEGGLTIAELAVNVTDRVVAGKRSISALLAREADLQSIGSTTTIAGSDLSNSATSITVANAFDLPAEDGVIFVGLECIRYESKSGNTLQNCVRGYRLTSPTPHRVNSRVYTFLPSLFRRKAFLYKGYQDLPMEYWMPAFGGVVAGVEKQGPTVAFRVASTLWNTYGDGRTVAFKWDEQGAGVTTQQHSLMGDFDVQFDTTGVTAPISNGHYLVKLAGQWNAIKGVT